MSLQGPRPGIGHNAAPSLDKERAGRGEACDYSDGLLAVAGPVIVLSYAGALGVAAFTFFGSADALFGVVVSMGFAVAYFAVPLLMCRTRNKRDARWQPDAPPRTCATVDLWTGPIRRWEGIAQIVSVPLAVLFGFAAFAVIWRLTA
jgi:hypothetical protein